MKTILASVRNDLVWLSQTFSLLARSLKVTDGRYSE
jgi:hypothetical protein